MKAVKVVSEPFYRKQETWLAIIAIATIIVYIPALSGQFTNWDDGAYIGDNPYLKTLSWDTLREMFSGNFMGNYHPLAMLSLNIDYQFGKGSSFVFHLTNLLFHTGSSLLVFFIVKDLTRRIEIAAIAGLLFGLHAIHVESVAWVSERKDVLYTFFYFLALFSYIRFTLKKGNKWYILALVFFLLSCFSKGQAVFFALTIVLVDLFRGRKLVSTSVLIEKLPFLIVALIFGFVAVSAQKEAAATTMVNFPLQERFAFASYGLVMYIAKLFLPVFLSAYYPYPVISTGGTVPIFYWLCIIPALALIPALWFLFKRYRELFFSLAFFLLNIAMLLQLLPVGRAIMADRYAYIPSFGYCFAVAWLIGKNNFTGNARLWYIAGCIYLVLLGYLTFQRTFVWKNSVDLWTDVVTKNRHVPIAWYNLGNVLSGSGKYKEAVDNFNESLKEDPLYKDAFVNRGQAKSKMKDYLGAIEDYNSAISIDPAMSSAYIDRAMAKRMLKDNMSAMEDYNIALRMKPNQPELYTSRGSLRFDLRDFKGAIDDYNTALSLDPRYVAAYPDRAKIKKALNDIDGAIGDYTKAIEFQPENADLYTNRGNLRFQSGQVEEAILDYNKSIQYSPRDILGYQNRAAALLKLKRYKEAIEDMSSAISIDGANGELYFTRAVMKQESGDKEGAVADCRKAIGINPAFAVSGLAVNLGISASGSAGFGNSQYAALAKSLEEQGKLAEAIQQYMKALQLKPGDWETWYNLGTTYGKNRQFADAISSFNKALEYKKDYCEAMSNRAVVKASMGKTDAALADFSKAVEMNPQYAPTYFNRALLYLNTGRKDKACEDLKKAVSLGYNSAYPIYQKECQK